MANQEFHCSSCKLVVTKSDGFPPDKKAGGACPRTGTGDHTWFRK